MQAPVLKLGHLNSFFPLTSSQNFPFSSVWPLASQTPTVPLGRAWFSLLGALPTQPGAVALSPGAPTAPPCSDHPQTGWGCSARVTHLHVDKRFCPAPSWHIPLSSPRSPSLDHPPPLAGEASAFAAPASCAVTATHCSMEEPPSYVLIWEEITLCVENRPTFSSCQKADLLDGTS